MKKSNTRKPTFPDNPTLPTAYEAAQLAIALYGRDAEVRPFQAVRAAMEIWLTAAFEISSAEGQDWNSCATQFRVPALGGIVLDGRVLEALLNREYPGSRQFGMFRLFKPRDLSDHEAPVEESSDAMDFINNWLC